MTRQRNRMTRQRNRVLARDAIAWRSPIWNCSAALKKAPSDAKTAIKEDYVDRQLASWAL